MKKRDLKEVSTRELFLELEKRRANNQHYQFSKKSLLPFSVVRSLFFFVLGCLIAHFIIGPLLFG